MLYKVLCTLVRVFLILLGLRRKGLENFPREGGVILASNHVSNWDPLAVAVAVNRPVHFMAKEELFNIRFLGTLLKNVNSFPVKRGTADRKAIRQALDILNDGEVLGIFPEGTRSTTGEQKAQMGVAMIALKSGRPVVPVACVGTNRKIPFGWSKSFEVRIGKPIYPEGGPHVRLSTSEMEAFSEEIMDKIIQLFSESKKDLA